MRKIYNGYPRIIAYIHTNLVVSPQLFAILCVDTHISGIKDKKFIKNDFYKIHSMVCRRK